MGKIVNQDLPADPPAPSAGNHIIYSKAAGVFVRTPTGVVGPLSAGGTVNNLQDAYDGGSTIVIPPGPVPAGSPVSITSNGNVDALSVTMGSGSTKTGVAVTHSGAGAAIVATALGTGNAVEVNSQETIALNVNVSGTSAAAKGLVVDLTTVGAGGIGVDVAVASGGIGVAVQQTGSGNGIYVLSTSMANAAVQSVVSNSGSAHAIKAEVTDLASTGAGLHIEYAGTSNAIEVQDTSFTTVFAVDKDGDTTTPSVIFGGSRITVEGDTGVAGDPLDPRVTLTSGGTPLGTLKRTYVYRSKSAGGPASTLDLDTVTQLPTVVSLSSYGGWTINLPSASKYPNGTEIIVLNEDTVGSFNVVTAAGRTIVNVANASASPQTISGGSGRRFMAFQSGSTDVYPVGARWVVTGTI